MEKITKRNVFEALINLVETGNLEFAIEGGVQVISGDELKAFAENEIALLDKKAVKAKERAAAKKTEADELTEVVFAALTDEFETIKTIKTRLDMEDVSEQKVAYRLRKLTEAGRAEKGELTIPGGDGVKASRKVAYKLA